MYLVLLGIVMGAGLSVQTVINSRLRGFLASPFLASAVSFSVGTLFLIVVALLSGQTLWMSAGLISDTPFWLWIGGVLGVIGLTTNILLFPYLGGVQTAIMPILGQVIMGMLIDNFGWFNSARHVFGMNRIAGATLVLAGIFLAVALPEWRYRHKEAVQSGDGIWLWRLLGIAAGMVSAAQTAVNGELGRVLHSSVHAALVSFFVGALTLMVFVGLRESAIGSRLKNAVNAGMPWWIWLGGALGGFFVFGSVVLVPEIGTGQTVVLALLGMIIGSLCVDQFGLLGAPRKPVKTVHIIGLLCLLIGVGLIRMI